MNTWQHLRQAELRAQAEEERLCQLYNCYPWEIETERKKNKHRRNEILPYLYKHIDNGVQVDDEVIGELFRKHRVIDEEADGHVEIVLEELSADLLEELLKLFIEANERAMARKSTAQRM